MSSSIMKQSVAEAVAEAIRENIITHNYRPGQRLKENQVCADLNVSHTPVREAFRILQSENLIKMIPYIGVEVVKFSLKDIRDLYGARRIIESNAAELAAQNGTDEQMTQLRIVSDQLDAIQFEDFTTSNEAEERFHLHIAKMTDNQELENILTTMYRRTQILRTMVLSSKEGYEVFKAQHKSVADAILANQPEVARKRMEEHFDTAIEYALKFNLEHSG